MIEPAAATIRLAHFSAASHLLDATETMAFFLTCIQRTKALRITGVLTYHDGGFFQVLEGRRDQVMRRLQEIRDTAIYASVWPLQSEQDIAPYFAQFYVATLPPTRHWQAPEVISESYIPLNKLTVHPDFKVLLEGDLAVFLKTFFMTADLPWSLANDSSLAATQPRVSPSLH